MNLVHIAGHVGRDPETRTTPQGNKVTSFTVATNSRKGGKDETLWWRVTVWGDRFDKMMNYVKKGSALMVTGELSLNEYTDKNGEKRASLEVNAHNLSFSPFGKGEKADDRESHNKTHEGNSEGTAQGQKAYSSFGASPDDEGDLPF